MNLSRNLPLFVAFRIGFNARFYYPVLSVFFLDLGLSLEQYALLNLAWALTIVTCELPSGALADLLGRRNLVVSAAALMTLEMLVLLFAPAGSPWLFPLLLLNRLISGLAEACASGADEALAYDSVPAGPDHDNRWSRVLATLGRCQSVAFMIVMLVGAAVYDPSLVGQSAGTPSRWPIALTLLMALGALACALAMREPPRPLPRPGSLLVEPWRQIARTARWIAQTPPILSLLAVGLSLDSVIRLFLTLESNFLRMLGFPERWFGPIAAAFSLVAFLVPTLARRMVLRWSAPVNFSIAATLALTAFFLLSAPSVPWATAALAPLAAAMSMNGLFVSYYLNRATNSTHRATVLSFKGLSFNLAYGLVGMAYAGTVASLRTQTVFPNENEAFRAALPVFPSLFLALILLATALALRARSAPERGQLN